MNKKRILYNLTPKALIEKTARTYNYFEKTVKDVIHIRKKIQEAIIDRKNGSEKIIVLGNNEIGEIAKWAAQELKLKSETIKDPSDFDKASMQKLVECDWPGNIRELRNLVERHVALADTAEITLEESFGTRPIAISGDGIDNDLPTLAELERRYIEKVLQRFDGNREKTAATLDINKSTLWRKLQQYRDAEDESSAG